MSSFNVTSECLELGLRARAIVLKGLTIATASQELRADIDAESRRLRERFDSIAEIRAMSELSAIREIIRSVGVKPKSHPPSTQKLLEYAWKQGTLPAINSLVDSYNLMSLRTRCSLGAHDLSRIRTPVELRLFRGAESFRPLGSDMNQQIHAGEFGYVDAEERVICRLDSLQADFSKVTTDTSDVFLIVESTAELTSVALDGVVANTRRIIERYCGTAADVSGGRR